MTAVDPASDQRIHVRLDGSARLLSLIVPAYNERDRLPRSLDRIEAFVATLECPCEVFVVDDGSTDATAAFVRERARRWPILQLVELPRNRGKGAAVRAGFAASRGSITAYTDADLAAPIEQLSLLLQDLTEADVAIVSRALPGARLRRRQSRVRETFGKMYAVVAQALLLRGVPDAQCGLKVYRGDLGRAVFRDVKEDGVIFDTEALLVATLRGARISQRPADWSHDPDSRIRFSVLKSIEILAALLRTKVRHHVLWPARVRGPIRSAGR